MSGSTSSGAGAGDRPRSAVGLGLDRVREAIEELRSPAGTTRTRPNGADARDAVLAALAAGPADGYAVARMLDRSAGAVYPALQRMAEEGLVTADAVEGRRIWALTPAGRAAAEAAQGREGDAAPGPGATDRPGGIGRSAARLAAAAAIAARTASPAQVGEVVAVLDDARRRVFAILGRA